MGTDHKKLQGASKVSRAVWPERIQWNLATGKAAQWRRAIMLRWFYQSDKQRSQKSQRHQKNRKAASSHHRHLRSLLFRTHRRVALSLPIISILLAVCLWQRWYVQLMLAALCTATNILVLHLLFNDVAPLRPVLAKRSPISLPRTVQTKPPDKAESKPLPTMTFPDTPMPATPLIRVLETIDLSSTDVEHFLELAEQSKQAKASSPSRESSHQSPE